MSNIECIHRVHLSEHFVHIPNTIARDKRISFRARGILVCVLSNAPEWRASKGWVQQQGTEGEDAITSAFRELERFGYARFEKTSDPETGRLNGAVWHYYGDPIPEEQRSNATRWKERLTDPPGSPVIGEPRCPDIPGDRGTGGASEDNQGKKDKLKEPAGQSASSKIPRSQPTPSPAQPPPVPEDRLTEIKDALASALGHANPTPAWWGQAGKVARAIILHSPDVTPDEVAARVSFLQSGSRIRVNLGWLEKEWDALRPEARSAPQLSTVPVWKQRQELESRIGRHPCNRESIANTGQETEAQWAEYRGLRAELKSLPHS